MHNERSAPARRAATAIAPARRGGNGGGWTDATNNSFPDWVQNNFSGTKTIDRVVVFTLGDTYGAPSSSKRERRKGQDVKIAQSVFRRGDGGCNAA